MNRTQSSLQTQVPASHNPRSAQLLRGSGSLRPEAVSAETAPDPIVLIAQARQGSPQAIASLMQQDLQPRGIEIAAWKRSNTLRLELMGPLGVRKRDMLNFICHGMEYLGAESIQAVQVSYYLKHEYNPRWVERLNLRRSHQHYSPRHFSLGRFLDRCTSVKDRFKGSHFKAGFQQFGFTGRRVHGAIAASLLLGSLLLLWAIV